MDMGPARPALMLWPCRGGCGSQWQLPPASPKLAISCSCLFLSKVTVPEIQGDYRFRAINGNFQVPFQGSGTRYFKSWQQLPYQTCIDAFSPKEA